MFLLGALLGMVWMSARNASGPRPSVLPIALLAALLGHMADLQFSFEVTATAALFWIVAGLIVAGYHIARPVQEAKAKPSPPAESVTATSRIGPSGWLVAASMLTIWVISCVFPLWADAQFQRSLDPTLSPDQRYAAARSATRLWPREPQYKLWLSVALQGVDEFELAAEQLRLAQRQIPNDAQLWGAWGGLYAQWGDRESSMRDHALTSFRRAKELAPASAYYRAALAWTLIDDDQLLAGIEELESAARIDGAYGGMLLQTKSSDQRQNALGASAVSGPR